jgi:hypothetical protein
MAARNFLKKAVYWPAVFLCILSIGSASASLGDQPAGAIHSGYVETMGLDTTDFPRNSLNSTSSTSGRVLGGAYGGQA